LHDYIFESKLRAVLNIKANLSWSRTRAKFCHNCKFICVYIFLFL